MERGDRPLRGEAPNVEMVYVDDAWRRRQGGAQFVGADRVRHPLEKQVPRCLQHPPSAPGENRGDDESEQWIHAGPAGEVNGQGGGNCRQAAEQVTQNMQRGGLHIDVVVAMTEPSVGDEIDDQANCRDDQGGQWRHRLRLQKALEGLLENPQHQQSKRQAVEKRRQDLHSMVSVGQPRRGGPTGQP